LAGSIYARSSIKLLHLVPFGQQTCLRGEDFLTLANQKKELLLTAMFIGRMEPNEEAL
jgi:hypothetical protein